MLKTIDFLDQNILCRHVSDLAIHPYYHRHNGCEIYLFLNGKVNYYIEEHCYPLVRGDILVIQPEEYHRVELVDKKHYERITINLEQFFFQSLSSHETDLTTCFFNRPAGQNNLSFLNEQQIGEFIMLFNHLKEANSSPEYGHDLLSLSYLFQILVMVNQAFRAGGNQGCRSIMPPLIRDIMLYIDGHLLDSFTLEDLSRQFFHKPSYISRRFKMVTGLTIQQYLLNKRIGLAQKYLKEGRFLTDVCWMSGFNNYSHFARTFSQQVGVSPKKYQNYIMSLPENADFQESLSECESE